MMKTINKINAIVCLLMLAQLSWAHINPNLQPPEKTNQTNTSLREDCLEAIETTFIEINNVRAMLQVGGDVWWNLDQGQYIVPVPAEGDEAVSAIFAGSVWVGGLDPNGNIKLAAGPNGAYYQRDGSVDWYSGPLDASGDTDKEVCDAWNTFFKLDGTSVRNFARLYDKEQENLSVDSIPEDVKYWPGKNNPYWGENFDFELPKDQSLGAFWDDDQDGDYNPLKGDFPIIDIRDCEPKDRAEAFELIPDEMIFWVYNDNGGPHRLSFATPIKMEVQVQAFAYKTNDAINDMTFNRYKLINKASEDIRETYFAMWVDPDLGCYQDDYIGCDPGRSLAYVYNEDAEDGINGAGSNCGDVPTYGTEVPMLGIDYFRGPRGPKLFSRDEFGNILLNEDGDTLFVDPPLGSGNFDTLVEIGMSAFTYMNNCSFNPPAATCDAQQADEFYGIMRGIWLDGTAVTNGGNGYNPGSTDSTRYVFPDPPNDPNGWSMCTADLPFGDRRTLQVTGPLLLQPLATNELIIGVVFVPDEQSYPCPDISRLLTADDLAQSLFDNCFNITDGPAAPTLCPIELDQEIIMTLFNDTDVNNYQEKYQEEDLQITDNTLTDEEKLYRFEGYQIYQLATADVSPQEFNNIEKARLAFQTDIKNGVSELYNWTSALSPIGSEFVWTPTLKVAGQDEGIQRTVSITEDLFATGDDKRLVNHKTYYYAAIAYGYNEYAPFNHLTGVGQPRPYIEGRGNIRTYSVTPRPIVYEQLNGTYGQVPQIVRLDGVGSGTSFVELEEGMYDRILTANANGVQTDSIIYKENAGPISVKIYNPLDVKDGEYKLEVIGDQMSEQGGTNFLSNDAKWRLTVNDEVIESDSTIDYVNEQLITNYGISVELNQINEPGNDVEVKNGAVGASFEYADSNEPNWFVALGDGGIGNGNTLFDWIINENETDASGDLSSLSSAFYPFTYARFADPGENQIPFYVTPAWRGTGQSFLNTYEHLKTRDLNNVDIVFTSDKSKWSRCIVVEAASSDYASAGLAAEGNAQQFDLRKANSVDKEGNEDGTGTGMGWFPGYAVDVETGQRLNIFFAENSVYNESVAEFLTQEATGADMIYNPTSEVFTNQAPESQPQFGIFNAVGGCQHFIYVTRTEYDECAELKDLLEGSNLQSKLQPYAAVTWAGFGLSNGNDGMGMTSVSEGLIPNELIVKLRVTNPFGYTPKTTFASSFSPLTADETVAEGGLPSFVFNLSGVEARAIDNSQISEAMDNVRAVPNPYYAYSAYERSEFDNQIKITNLPAQATVTIYSLDGKFIRQYNRDESPMSKGADKPVQTQQAFPDLSWDLKNDKGVPVASGVYLIHVVDNNSGEEKVIKWFGVGRRFDPSNL